MEIHNSKLPYYLACKTKSFIIDFDMFSDDEIKNWPQFYLERGNFTQKEIQKTITKMNINYSKMI